MKRISTHVLDVHRGKPAAGVPVRLEFQEASGSWRSLNSTRTDQDGRCPQLLTIDQLPAGLYRLVFDTGSYFDALQIESQYPYVEVTFRVRDDESHLHIPLLLSANGYTTYRGS
jgi:5-hydroxyisourate hydrolase